MPTESPFAGAIRRMLLCDMPDDVRRSLETLLARDNVSEYELKTVYANVSRRLVLSRPRDQMDWNPTVNDARCVGCAACFRYCPHGVYEMKEGKATVVRPTECVILCHNCEALCPIAAIAFPAQKDYAELLRYE